MLFVLGLQEINRIGNHKKCIANHEFTKVTLTTTRFRGEILGTYQILIRIICI